MKIGAILSRFRKQILMLFDVCALTVCYLAPWVLISGRAPYAQYSSLLVASCFLFVCCFEIVYGLMGMYDSLWRYAEVVEFFRLCTGSAIAIFLFVASSLLIFQGTGSQVPISVYFLSAMFSAGVTMYSRLVYRMYRNVKLGKKGGQKARRTLLIGAGDAASTLLHEQFKKPSPDMNIICCVDDAPEKQGRYIMGIQIMGTTEDIPEIVEQCEIESILLAIPTMDEENKRRVLSICNKTKCNIKILPDIVKMITDGQDLASRIRDVKVEDLLGREEVQLSVRIAEFLRGKRVMVTGGGGSIGSELCRQIASCEPKELLLVDIYENSAYEIQQELRRKYGDKLDLQVQIASVRDSKKMDALFEHYRPEIVFHAAAHKHVPLMEDSPEEAVKNNVFGTFNVASSADRYGAERFVLISTDKAVNPTNVMGATKRVCEMIVQAMAQRSKTRFAAVRFGNVLGSNGSVIPLFKDQIACGGPVTVTHPDIVRYFMTISEAVSLVLEAGSMATGGEIFVLDMGKPMRILDLAENLIKLSGFIPYKDIQIVFTGLRPGEKLFEELLMDEEGLRKTENRKIYIGAPLKLNNQTFFDHLMTLKQIAYTNNSDNLVQALIDMVPTFHHKTNCGQEPA
ncbi:nucleoside-diphosphate sugar epimerase/dehydratase [Gemmiger sp. An50]|uniref:polysaccharide biosynthesis protein n=1 Tax=Gemmiger sp. An50 TaxID=1965639 RepID=UPI000B3825E0|nr:nucleoside-diphosphate sugar epimerase/dehydratase [Gemmiger sp. An50]OUN83908.1 UDP-N-acetylglucosamine 4,6-dehydratase [Gemmiger sp. An50]